IAFCIQTQLFRSRGSVSTFEQLRRSHRLDFDNLITWTAAKYVSIICGIVEYNLTHFSFDGELGFAILICHGEIEYGAFAGNLQLGKTLGVWFDADRSEEHTSE